jgi:hypothetical protein
MPNLTLVCLFLLHSQLNRHRMSLPELQDWVPDDVLQYCREHQMLDQIMGSSPGMQRPSGSAATSDYRPPYSAAAAP